MDLVPKESGRGRWIVLLVEFGLKILPCGDRIVRNCVKPSRCAATEREWEKTQVDSVLRHTRDIECITYPREAGQMSRCILILKAMKLGGMSDHAHDMLRDLPCIGVRNGGVCDRRSRPSDLVTCPLVHGTSRWWVSVAHGRKWNWAIRTYLGFVKLFQTLPKDTGALV
ncbi:hypothetical protein L1987_18891 [Smallanthus sonchifolius]|uniref:Uncharacterized protein n=1 Tax=Smallanthus sonchifolius TaxID=185202 RepID=A0ACB9J1T1_9ASTR|nr:hypothetical protein L1987_18891 [Smallanthus sonchifolius]